jgi:YesN/AraC family two-component response regulator
LEESNILIVDDEKEILTSLKRALYDEPYTVFTAGSGKEALALLSEKPFKVILSDINMPVMDGFELLELVRAQHPDIVCIVFSGLPDVNLILNIVNARQIERYLTKPWNAVDVKMTIQQCIELYDLRKEVAELRKRGEELS